MKTLTALAFVASTLAVPSTLLGASSRSECFSAARAEYKAEKIECESLSDAGERSECIAEARSELRSEWDACPVSNVD